MIRRWPPFGTCPDDFVYMLGLRAPRAGFAAWPAGIPFVLASNNGSPATSSIWFDFTLPADYHNGESLTVEVEAYILTLGTVNLATSIMWAGALTVNGGSIKHPPLATDGLSIRPGATVNSYATFPPQSGISGRPTWRGLTGSLQTLSFTVPSGNATFLTNNTQKILPVGGTVIADPHDIPLNPSAPPPAGVSGEFPFGSYGFSGPSSILTYFVQTPVSGIFRDSALTGYGQNNYVSFYLINPSTPIGFTGTDVSPYAIAQNSVPLVTGQTISLVIAGIAEMISGTGQVIISGVRVILHNGRKIALGLDQAWMGGTKTPTSSSQPSLQHQVTTTFPTQAFDMFLEQL